MHAALARALAGPDRGRRRRRPHHRRGRASLGGGGRPAAGARGGGARGGRRGARERVRRGAGAVRARAGALGAGAGSRGGRRASSQIDLLKRAAFAADQAGEPARQEALLRRAFELVGEEARTPRACALLRERLSQSLWSQHRQDEAIEELNARTGAVPRGRPERGARHAAVAAREEAHGAGSADRGEGRRRGGARDRARVGQPRGRGPGAERARNGPRHAGRRGGRRAAAARVARHRPASSAQEMDMGGAWVNIADVLNTRGPHPRGARGRAPGPRGRVEQPVADRRLAAALDRRVPVLPRRLGRGRGDDPRREPAPQRRTRCSCGRWAARCSRWAAATWRSPRRRCRRWTAPWPG